MSIRATPVRAKTSHCACLRLRKASRRVTQIYDQHLEPYGLTVTQFSLLGHLKTLDGIAIGTLADALVMDPTTLNRVLKPLQTRGFVASTTGEQDARTRHLHITGTGLAIHAEARPGWLAAQDKIARALGRDDNQRFADIMDLLLERLAD
jgi:DNA-binding MarR family transcriptional regulator